jgi:hypothetical protein
MKFTGIVIAAAMAIVTALAQGTASTQRRQITPEIRPLPRPATRSYLKKPPASGSQTTSTLLLALHDDQPLPVQGDILCNPVHFPVPGYPPQNLQQIKVRGSRNNLTWYFMDYLTNHPNRLLTRRYFPVGLTELTTLPPDAPPPAAANLNPPVPRHIPGEYPNQEGLHS